MIKKNTQTTEATEYSTTLSRLSQKTKIFQTEHGKSRFNELGNKKQVQPTITQVEQVLVEVKKRRIYKKTIQQQFSELPKVNPSKFKADIKSIAPTQYSGQNLQFAISTCKGFKNMRNLHQMGVNLGLYQYAFLAEGYDGPSSSQLIKDIFPIEFSRFFSIDINQQPEKYLNKVYEQTQKKLVKELQKINDNSGTSLSTILFLNNVIIAANCGASRVVCCTYSDDLFELASPHLTINLEEKERLLNNNVKIYQSVLQVPEQNNLIIGGPTRVSDTGLYYTRTLGKKCEYNKLTNKAGLTYYPEIRYVNKAEVKWVSIISESIINFCHSEMIKQCINQQMRLYQFDYDYNKIAKKCTRRLIKQMLNLGIQDGISVMIFFPNQGGLGDDCLSIKGDQFRVNNGDYQAEEFKGNRRNLSKYNNSEFSSYRK